MQYNPLWLWMWPPRRLPKPQPPSATVLFRTTFTRTIIFQRYIWNQDGRLSLETFDSIDLTKNRKVSYFRSLTISLRELRRVGSKEQAGWGEGYYSHIWATQGLVPGPHHFARPASFKCGQGEPIVSDTSPKCNDREGLRSRRTGTRQG